MARRREQSWLALVAPYPRPVNPDAGDPIVCECGYPAVCMLAAPADTGPFTGDIPEVITADPRWGKATWDMPVCATHAMELTALTQCSSCNLLQYAVDMVGNGSTVTLCRPCNARENGLPDPDPTVRDEEPSRGVDETSHYRSEG